jgi:hypothetical protein
VTFDQAEDSHLYNYGTIQCLTCVLLDLAPLEAGSGAFSNGNNTAQAAVIAKIAADTIKGKEDDMVNKTPAATGAIIPVLLSNEPQLYQPNDASKTKECITYNRLRAADVPHAVPLMEIPKISGVMPSRSTAWAQMDN